MNTETEKKYVTLDKNGFATETGWIVVYNYNYETKEFTGSTEEYVQVGVGVPAQSTTTAPVEAKDGFSQVFNTDSKSWNLVEDHRNQNIYDITTGSQTIVTQLGPIDSTKYTTIAPTSKFDEWDGKKWVVNQDKKKAADVAEATATKQVLYTEADRNIKDLQFAVDLEMATDDEKTELTGWKKYCVYLNRVDTSAAPTITWPEKPTR